MRSSLDNEIPSTKFIFDSRLASGFPKESDLANPYVPRLPSEVVHLVAVILFAASVALWTAITNAPEGYENVQGWYQGREFAES